MKKKKGYITIFLILIGFYAIAKIKKPKSKIIVDLPINVNPYSIVGGTVYEDDLKTPIYTFRNEIKLGIIEYDQDFDVYKVTFSALNSVITGWLNANKIIYK